MRVCLVYDCLFPYTVGGAERWYRNLGERLAADGHEVTYLTMRQWGRGERAEVRGVRVVAVGPRMALYTRSGRRRILQALVFGVGVLWHILRTGGSYDVVHTASFPYFSLLAVGTLRPLRGYRLVVDWHEVWSRAYWLEYLGRIGGRIGHSVQAVCVRIPQRAFCFSRLHARRLVESGYPGQPTILGGEYAGALEQREPEEPERVVMFAGRHIPEKRVPAIIPAVAVVRRTHPDVRCVVFGDGPERARVEDLVQDLGLGGVISVPGFVDASEVERWLRRSACLVLPSRREGYGMIVIEAAAAGTPSVVVSGDDNAATELVEEGANGFIAESAGPDDLARAINRAIEGEMALRRRTAGWFGRNARRLSLESSLERVAEAYAAQAKVTR
jgi:glycosyltransferase involved in cell wall biosynthesis